MLLVALLFTFIVHSLWECCLIALLSWLVLRCFRRSDAETRCITWTVAFIACIALPIATSAVTVGSPSAPAVAVRDQSRSRVAPATDLKQSSTVLSATSSGVRAWTRPHMEVPTAIEWGAVAVWALIVCWMMARLAFALVALERLKRNALPLPIEHRDGLAQWHARAPTFRDVRLCVCPQIEVPIALGLGDSVILLPSHLIEALSPEELDDVILHELAHLQRGDDWINAVQRVIGTLLFFHPVVRWLGARLDVEREVACDRLVVAHARNVGRYARCLTKIAEVTAWPHAPLAAPGVFTTRKTISVRIERLLKPSALERVHVSYRALALTAIAVAGLFIVSTILAPTIVPASAHQRTTYTRLARSSVHSSGRPSPVKHITLQRQERTQVSRSGRSILSAAVSMAPTNEPARSRVGQRSRPAPSAEPAAPARPIQARAVSVSKTVPSTPDVAPSDNATAHLNLLDALQVYGYHGFSTDDLVNLANHGVTAALLSSLHRYGLHDLASGDLISLTDHGVSASYLDGLSASGFKGLSAPTLVTLRDHGVDGSYVAGLHDRGLAVTPEQAASLMDQGVSLTYVDSVQRAWGRSRVTVDQLTRLRESGVDTQ